MWDIPWQWTQRSDGDMRLPSNRDQYFARMGIDPATFYTAEQVHGHHVCLITSKSKNNDQCCGDALVTDRKGVCLGIHTADCLPLCLYDSQSHVMGLVHAGWRGSQQGIVAQTIKAMQEHYAVKSQNVSALMGPCLRSCCFEIQEDVASLFPCHTVRRKNHRFLDLVGYNVGQLRESGVPLNRIVDSHICTVCQNKDYFSYRKEHTHARFLTLLKMR